MQPCLKQSLLLLISNAHIWMATTITPPQRLVLAHTMWLDFRQIRPSQWKSTMLRHVKGHLKFNINSVVSTDLSAHTARSSDIILNSVTSASTRQRVIISDIIIIEQILTSLKMNPLRNNPLKGRFWRRSGSHKDTRSDYYNEWS